jgi:hypothetical protein
MQDLYGGIRMYGKLSSWTATLITNSVVFSNGILRKFVVDMIFLALIMPCLRQFNGYFLYIDRF